MPKTAPTSLNGSKIQFAQRVGHGSFSQSESEAGVEYFAIEDDGVAEFPDTQAEEKHRKPAQQ